ncbi:hypothetical protein [Moorena sp. SIO3H5]|uniref:hypothetical protein n=1 Tax=Moorena sp. SIO3H5 TaxID=2607834 RepID=UPI0013BE4B25|nr:hypothetical protein [Moorena sp. SIO3H5]NEO68981.1 hypothetical protein [Moorena sp. SIO3H5]
MAKINIKDISALNLSGSELFDDSESFMVELNEETETTRILGGGRGGCCFCSLVKSH